MTMRGEEERVIRDIRLEGVGFTYDEGVCALHDVSATLRRDEFVGIIGANGSGKSTLAYLLQGRLTPTAGVVRTDGGRPLAPQPEASDTVVVVGADPESQLIATSVFEEVAFAPRAARLPASEVLARTADALDRCDLAGLAARHPGALSAGEQLRVLLAAAVVRRPGWLVLDEVGSMLDDRHWHALLALLLALHDEREMGLIVITHRLEDLLDADRVLVLVGGMVALEGTPAEVLARAPAEPEWHVTLPLTSAVGALVRSVPIRAALATQTWRAAVGARRAP